MPEQDIRVEPTPVSMAQSLGRVEGMMKGIGHEIHDIKEENQKQWEHIEENREKLGKVELDLHTHLTANNTEKEVKERFYKKHPLKTIAIGGLGGLGILGTIITIIVYVILKLDELGVLP